MKYGQITERKSVNSAIYHCFQYIDGNDIRKFVRKFKEQPHYKVQMMHTYRELLLGAFLASNNLRVRSEYKFGNKTPDWCIVNEDTQPICVVELVNFHADAWTELEIGQQILDRGIWCGFVKPNTNRIYKNIQEKAEKYKILVNSNGLAYVVAIFSEVTASVKESELEECLSGEEAPLFELFPEMSGILFFEEISRGRHLFTFKENPRAIRTITLPNGWFET